ncbi:SIS domain-containing protein, partial [Lactobacillus crispatus]
QNKLDIKQLKKIIQLIKSAKRVYFYGIGSSGYTSLEATQRLLRMGISAFAETESNNMFMTSSIISKDDLIIAISSTGSTDSLVRAIELAKKNKATVVALTSYDNSPLAQLADIVVGVQDTNYINDARFINSQFSIMYVIDVITTLLLKNNKYHDRMTRTITSVLNEKYDAYNK